jgi:hypothetical protein
MLAAEISVCICRAVRSLYSGDLSFNVLYQSPLGNAAGALAGLLLAHVHHSLRDRDVRLATYRVLHFLPYSDTIRPYLSALTPPCFVRHVKPFVPAALTVVSIHS